jgi:uncharacterized membrane-anchored protein YitT (DUF2179 family)
LKKDSKKAALKAERNEQKKAAKLQKKEDKRLAKLERKNLTPEQKAERKAVRRRREKNLLLDTLFDVIGGFIYATGLYSFAKMANFSPGGISGLALLANALWDVPIGSTTLILNIPLILISWKVVGWRFLVKSARTMVISTIILDLIFPMTPAYTGSPMMAALYSGLCLGTGMALFYMRGSSSGGMDFLIMTIKVRKPYFSFGVVTMTTDFLVILLGWPVFGNVDAVLYGLIASFSASIVMDRILYGVGAGKLLIIITNHGQEIAKEISAITDRGSTLVNATGTYTGEDRDVLLCACSKSQTYQITNAAHELDENAFIMVTETSEVFGEGFKLHGSNKI